MINENKMSEILKKLNKERKLEEGEAINIETLKELFNNKGDENE